MHFSTYLRIENLAGGCLASDRSFIRALRSRLNKKALKRGSRDIRRELIADMFELRNEAKKVMIIVNRGI
jgi:hypothetical protein